MKDNLVAELRSIIKPFIETGIYKNEEEALENILEDLVEIKISKYKEEIKGFQNKHETTFSKFTEKIRLGKHGSIEEENQWMEWEAAINMLEAWTKIKKSLVYAG